MKFRFSIRALVSATAIIFVTFVVANQLVERRVASLPSQLVFEDVKDSYQNSETPKPLRTEIETYHSLADYLLFRRRAKVVSDVELIYGGEYGGGLTHRMPGEPHRRVKCQHMYHVNLFSSKLISRDYIGLDSPIWITKEDGQYPIVNGVVQ